MMQMRDEPTGVELGSVSRVGYAYLVFRTRSGKLRERSWQELLVRDPRPMMRMASVPTRRDHPQMRIRCDAYDAMHTMRCMWRSSMPDVDPKLRACTLKETHSLGFGYGRVVTES
jgi:hypothetical protein